MRDLGIGISVDADLSKRSHVYMYSLLLFVLLFFANYTQHPAIGAIVCLPDFGNMEVVCIHMYVSGADSINKQTRTIKVSEMQSHCAGTTRVEVTGRTLEKVNLQAAAVDRQRWI